MKSKLVYRGHSYCMREAEDGVAVINVAKRQQRTAVISAYVLFSRLHVKRARLAGSDGSMSASGSAGPGFKPVGVVNFNLKIFNLGARRGGDVYFLIAGLYITVLD